MTHDPEFLAKRLTAHVDEALIECGYAYGDRVARCRVILTAIMQVLKPAAVFPCLTCRGVHRHFENCPLAGSGEVYSMASSFAPKTEPVRVHEKQANE